jgi:hypothetical protein
MKTERLREKQMVRITFTVPTIAGISLVLFGSAMLYLSVYYSYSIFALIGLGLAFWGIILGFIQSQEYAKSSVLDATAVSLLTEVNRTLEELDFKGKAVYLPPKYFVEQDGVKAYLPKDESEGLPPPEEVQEIEAQPSSRSQRGNVITPPGADLTRLFESTLATNFVKVGVGYIRQNLPRLLTDDLEIARDLEVRLEKAKASESPDDKSDETKMKTDRVYVKMSTRAFEETFKLTKQLPRIYSRVGCPVTSAIASAIARASGKPTIIESEQISENNRTIEMEYSILAEKPE